MMRGRTVGLFLNEPILEKLGLLGAIRDNTEMSAAIWEKLLAGPTPSALGICSDQDQKQLAGTLGFQKVRLCDNYHFP